MGSHNFRFNFFLAALVFVIGLPVIKSVVQEVSIGQDVRRVQMEYSLYGSTPFRARLEEIVERAPLNLKDVNIKIQERQPQSKVLVEISYVSRMDILFVPLKRNVVVRREIPLVQI